MTPRWKEDILLDLPEPRTYLYAYTFPSALEQIRIAAFNRRMKEQDYIGRAAAAFAVYDSGGDLTWEALMRPEPVMYDGRRRNLPKKRHFGRDFGPWHIEELS
jgi:hypothetical protein